MENANLTVKYKNELNVIPMRKFSSKEMDLFFSICAKMKDKGVNTIRFEFEELRGLSNYKKTAIDTFVKDLDNVYSKMLQLTYRMENENEIIRFVLFNSFKINKTQGFVDISINSDFEYVLNQITNEFTYFELKEFTHLSSSYSKTMYRLLKQFKSTGYYTVKVNEFRELLDIPKSYRMSDIDKYVLKPIKKELGEHFEPFEIKKVKAQKGNKIDRLEFYFVEKEKEETEELPHIPLYNWLEGK